MDRKISFHHFYYVRKLSFCDSVYYNEQEERVYLSGGRLLTSKNPVKQGKKCIGKQMPIAKCLEKMGTGYHV